MALKFEYQKSNYGLVNEGIYEMNLTVSLKVTETNKKYINLDLKIRDDGRFIIEGQYVTDDGVKYPIQLDDTGILMSKKEAFKTAERFYQIAENNGKIDSLNNYID